MPTLIEPQQELEELGLEIISIDEEFIDTFRSSISVKTAWADRFVAIADIMGGINKEDNIQLPVRYDRFLTNPDEGDPQPIGSNAPMVVALGASVRNFLDDDGQTDTTVAVAKPSFARIDIEFMVPPWTVHSQFQGTTDWVLTETFEPSAEFLTISEEELFWKGKSSNSYVPVKESIGKLQSMATWTITVHYVSADELDGSANFADLVGSVNEVAKVSPRFGIIFDAETLLFQPPRIMEHVTPLGLHYDVEFPLQWRPTDDVRTESSRPSHRPPTVTIPQGWNVFHRPGYNYPQPLYIEDPKAGKVYFRPYEPKQWKYWIPRA